MPASHVEHPYDRLMRQTTTSRKGGTELSTEQIVRAAIELLDEGGIDAFRMRALAQKLGCSTMAAYRHVENRDALIRLAADSVQTDLPEVGTLPWYERLEAFARHGWTTSWRLHPWVIDYIDSGGASEQATLRLEAMTQVFRDAGFREQDVLSALTAHWSFVIGTLRLIITMNPDSERNVEHENAIFDFNLRTWILGLSAMVHGYGPVDLEESTRTAATTSSSPGHDERSPSPG